jgi:MFS family permease
MDQYAPHDWKPSERPFVPGSPSTPDHSIPVRVAFGSISVLLGITGGLGNALVTVNLPYLQGSLGADSAEIAWLPAAYAMTYVSMNLMLVKFRQQFGLTAFTRIFLSLYVLVTLAHLFVNSSTTAVAVRAAHGMVGAALTSLSLYYMIQALPQRWRLKAVVLGFGSSQLAPPIARLISVDLLQIDQWRGLYRFELGLALFALACVFLLRLPPGDRTRTFEKLDFLSFAFLSTSAGLLCAVLSLGRIDWWLDAPWMGVASALSIALGAIGILIERNRQRPLLNLDWLASGNIVRLALAMILIKIILSEQNIGAVGLFQLFGLTNEQTQTLFWIVLAGALAGLVISALTISLAHLTLPVVVALGLMLAGAAMDSFATQDTRPSNLYLSQFLLAFGGTLFLGPTLLTGLGGVLANPKNLISFAVLFSMTQNIGGLAGSALMGTLQTVREKFHSGHLVEHLTGTDPIIADAISHFAANYGGVIVDPSLQRALGQRALGAIATREANILAYNDVFMVIAAIAAGTILCISARAMAERVLYRQP